MQNIVVAGRSTTELNKFINDVFSKHTHLGNMGAPTGTVLPPPSPTYFKEKDIQCEYSKSS